MADLLEIDALLARVPEKAAPGPWYWNPDEDPWTVYDGTGERVFEVMLNTDNFETPAESLEDSANAQLGALAPELASALRALRAEVERLQGGLHANTTGGSADEITLLTDRISDLTRERDAAREALADRVIEAGGQAIPNDSLTLAVKRARAALTRERDALTPAADDVLAERRRQVIEEGWTIEHDDAHGQGQMAGAAACYALYRSHVPPEELMGEGILDMSWPWDGAWWKPTSRRRDLVKAGALILAEIERLDRAALSPTTKGGADA